MARTSKTVFRMLGDEMMIIVPLDSTLFLLNEVASVISNAADGKTPLSEIVGQPVCSEFNVELAVALRDAEHVVKGLAGHGILVISGDSQPCSEQRETAQARTAGKSTISEPGRPLERPAIAFRGA